MQATLMSFYRIGIGEIECLFVLATEDDYPELEQPRIPWDEWGPQEQERNLRKAIGEHIWRMIDGKKTEGLRDIRQTGQGTC
jgi:hypothetical protein